MVRVLSCHHFATQDVVTSEEEPVALHVNQGMLFVATRQCTIDVYSLLEPNSPLITRLHALAAVRQISHSHTDNFIATLEQTLSGTVQSHVRVYLNWEVDISAHPVTSRVAGHTAWSRDDAADDKVGLDIVDLPLKGTVSCIAVNTSVGHLAVAVEKTLLIYGLCCKTVASTDKTYKDMKCLLDLSFSFRIKKVVLCEEYIACSNQTEVQVIRLNIKNIPLFSVQSHDPGAPLKDVYEAINQCEKYRLRTAGQLVTESGQPKDLVLNSDNKKKMDTSQCCSKASAMSELLGGRENYGSIVEDKHYVVVNCDISGEKKCPEADASQNRTNDTETDLVLFDSVAMETRKKRFRAKDIKTTVGGISKHCPVTVEYEGICCSADSSSDLVSRGVVTCFYRKLKSEDGRICTINLKPFYIFEGGAAESNVDEVWTTFLSTSRSSLRGLSFLFSTSTEGYLYHVGDEITLLETYPYTSEAVEVCVDDNFLYVATLGGLEIYTHKCVSVIMRDMEGRDQTLPQVDCRPCMIGLKPFPGIDSIKMDDKHVILLSKMDGEKKSEDIAWSIYNLHKPSELALYQDMVELGQMHQKLSPSFYRDLLLEAHLVGRGYQLLHGTNPDVTRIVEDSAERLGHSYAAFPNEKHKALLYFVLSRKTTVQLLSPYLKHSEQTDLSAVTYYLDYVLFDSDEQINLTETEAKEVLKMYCQHRPEGLSQVILHPAFSILSSETTLDALTKWPCVSEKKTHLRKTTLDILVLATLYLETGDPGEAEELIAPLLKDELIGACVEHHKLLHHGFSELSSLSQLLRKVKRGVFLEVLVVLHDNRIINMDTAIHLLLRRKSDNRCSSTQNNHIKEYLELLLSDKKRRQIYKDAALQLCDIYIDNLKRSCSRTFDNSKIVPSVDVTQRTTGHFAKRFNWLDYLPPFTGPKSWRTRCTFMEYTECCQNRLKIGKAMLPPQKTRPIPNERSKRTCCCNSCNADLLKLQSLLCSEYTDPELLKRILDICGQPSLEWSERDSVYLICLARIDPEAVCDHLIGRYPSALTPFLQHTFGTSVNEQMWMHILDNFVFTWKQLVAGDTEKEKCTTYEKALNDLLSLLAAIFPPTDFERLLPQDLNQDMFLPYLEQSHLTSQAKQLKQKLMDKAREDLASGQVTCSNK